MLDFEAKNRAQHSWSATSYFWFCNLLAKCESALRVNLSQAQLHSSGSRTGELCSGSEASLKCSLCWGSEDTRICTLPMPSLQWSLDFWQELGVFVLFHWTLNLESKPPWNRVQCFEETNKPVLASSPASHTTHHNFLCLDSLICKSVIWVKEWQLCELRGVC